ncbi:MAG: trigger factor, partial [Synergistales bacterium]|nr:trigger factor [Synergistales bacterium]
MRTEIVSQEKNLVAIKAEVEADEFQKSINKTLNELSHKVTVPGFRKGKVPRRVLELRYGKGTLLTEALEDLVPDIISEIIKDYELDLIEEPKLEIETMEEGKPLLLKFTFYVTPEITLPEITNLEVEKLKVQATEEMVNEAIDSLVEKNATFEKLDERTTTAEDDLVEISYATQILDEEGNILKSHEPSNTILDLQQEGLKEDIRSGLTGVEIGSQVEIDTEIDEEFPEKDLAGKTAHYSINLLSIKKK